MADLAVGVSSYHSDTSADSRLGSSGRSIQWLPDSSTVWRKPARTNL